MNQNESATETTKTYSTRLVLKSTKATSTLLIVSQEETRSRDQSLICKLVRCLSKEHIKASDIGLPTDSALRHALILDHLTPQVQSLLGEAMKIQTRNEHKFCWVKNFTTYLRKEENSQHVAIKSIEDLENLENR
ncbi:Hypothetical predicted protein [Paramuricea clavata]|uniref:FP protein C-terminal domain-containing protein n=1 Tax=Paramuricea clavata TaxID=317549 RepID=A0A6S7GJE7_PARCT|nr:Hypothetical predicted protein [Paramuricea clavata]